MPIKVGTTSIKIPFDKAYVGSTLVYTSIVPSPYDYGDGSLNKTQMGYQNKLYVNGVIDTSSLSAANWGNYQIASAMYSLLYDTAEVAIQNNQKIKVLSGTNTYNVAFDATNGDKTCNFRITGGGGTSSAQIGSLEFNCNGTFMNLSEMVTAGIIKPLVLITSSGNSNYSWHDVLKLYDNSAYTDTRSYPEALFFFMINKGNNITQARFYANRNFSTSYDGITYVMSSIDDVRMTLNAYT